MATDNQVDLSILAVRRGSDPGDQMPPLRRHVLTRYVLPGALVLGFLTLTAWAARGVFVEEKPVTIVPVHVSLASVQQAGTPLFQAAGWVEPRPTPVRVAALASGTVKELLVVEDQFLEAGEPIATLINEDAQLAFDAAKAMYALRAAEVSQIKATLRAAETNFEIPAHLEVPLAQAEAELARIETEIATLPLQQARAEARLRLAEVDLQAKRRARDAITEVSLQQSQSELDAVRAEVEEYRSRLPVLRQQRDALQRKRDAVAKRLELKTDERQAWDEAKARLQSAEAALQAARVAMDEAQLRLDRMVIRAPVTGRVLKLIASPGTQLVVGSMQGRATEGGGDASTVVTMYQPERLQVRVDVRFEDLPRVGRDQPVLVESPAWPEPLEGHVLFLTGFANIQKNTLEVKTTLENPPSVMKPEMLVDVTFLAPPTPESEQADEEAYRILVPRELVETSEGGASVWVAQVASQTAHRQAVELGAVQTGAYVEVTSGLTAGSRLIASGRQGLQHGDRIRIVGEDQSLGAVGFESQSETSPAQ